jgi:hypothetical protein
MLNPMPATIPKEIDVPIIVETKSCAKNIIIIITTNAIHQYFSFNIASLRGSQLS